MPGFREVVGTLKRRRRPLGARDGPHRASSAVLGDGPGGASGPARRGARHASPAGETVMNVEGITAIPDSAPGDEALGSPDVVGKVVGVEGRKRRSEPMLMLQPEPMRLVLPPDAGAELGGLRRQAGERGRRPPRTRRSARHAPRRAGRQSCSVQELLRLDALRQRRAGNPARCRRHAAGHARHDAARRAAGRRRGRLPRRVRPKNRITALIEINIANLAGVPSIIWGLAGLGLFIYLMRHRAQHPGGGADAGAARAADRDHRHARGDPRGPRTIREAAIALGATKWQTTRYHVIPYSMSGILTGSIIAMCRAIGETAPLVVHRRRPVHHVPARPRP